MRGSDGEHFADPRRRAGGLRHLVPHFRQLAERAGAEHRIEHELRQLAAAHAAGDDVVGAEPQHDDDAGKGEEQRGDGDDGARLGHRPRRLVGLLGGGAEAGGGEDLGDEGLHDAHRRQALGGEGGGVGEPVLGAPRTRRAPPGRRRKAAGR